MKEKCTLCGSEHLSEIYKRKGINTGLKEYNTKTLRYVMCNGCTLVFLNPRMSEEEYETFYKEDYQEYRHGIKDYEEAIAHRKRKKGAYERRMLRAKDLRGYVDENSSVLEVGAGWGTLLQAIKDTYHCAVTGMEVSDLGARLSKEYYKLDVSHETFDQFYNKRKDDGVYDLIIFTHVLEHILEPVAFLKRVNKLLSSKGHIYIAVPNVAQPDEPLDRFFHIEHTFYFSILTLVRILKKAGFSAVRIATGAREIKIIASKSDANEAFIGTKHFSTLIRANEKVTTITKSDMDKLHILFSKRRIRRTLLLQKYKYIFLRLLKQITESLIPKSLSVIIMKVVVSALRKVRIIEV